jgi:hypothetical protein
MCDYHENQSFLNEDTAFCGMMSFNNAMHTRVLHSSHCLQISMKWVGAKHARDPALNEVADARGRGAFSISVLKVALEKQGFMIRNLKRVFGTDERIGVNLIFQHVPCVVLVSPIKELEDNSPQQSSHAVSICGSKSLHDPDLEIPFKIDEGSFQKWLDEKQCQVANVYTVSPSKRIKKNNKKKITSVE